MNRRAVRAGIVAVTCALGLPARAALHAQGAQAVAPLALPASLADSTFWRLVTEMSEAGGYFRSDNFVSNETSYQYVIPDLQRTLTPKGVYLGVAPDQNFTYIVAFKPAIAFIVDIRRQNMLHHLMYKAIIEMAPDRAEFLSRLFSRPRPATLGANANVDTLLAAFTAALPDSVAFRKNLAAITDRLTRHHRYTLSAEDLHAIEYVYGAFYAAGPEITYAFPNAGRGWSGMRGFPSFALLMGETDGQGARRSYLASEENYAVLRDYEVRNLIVPIVGDFSGDKALRAVGTWARDRAAPITAFYTSNVEQYLFQQPDAWQKFYANVATLPIDSTSTFIRSLSNGTFGRTQSPNSRSLQLVQSIGDLLKAVADGKVAAYFDVIQLSK